MVVSKFPIFNVIFKRMQLKDLNFIIKILCKMKQFISLVWAPAQVVILQAHAIMS